MERIARTGLSPIMDAESKLKIEAIRKKVLPLPHKTFGYRGSSVSPRELEMYPPGSTIRFDGTKSVSKDVGVAETFARMNEPGGTYRGVQHPTSYLERYGLENIGASPMGPEVRHARTAEEEQLMLRAKRMDNVRGYYSDKQAIAEYEAQLATRRLNPNSMENRYGIPELESRIERTKGIMSRRGEEAKALRDRAAFLKDRESIIWELELAEGLPALSLGDQSRFIKGSGTFNEKEILMTGMEGQVVKYYRDSNGRLRGRVRVNNAERFAAGGQLSGYGGGDKVPALLEPGEFVINKKAAAANAPLLEQINSNMTQARQNGGGILKLQTGGPTPGFKGLNQRLGGTTGFMMNAMFLPMMLPMMNEMEGFTGALMKAVIGLQIFTMGLQAASMVSGVFGKVSAAKGIANAASRSGASAGMIAGGMGGGKLTQMAANFKAGNATGIFGKMGGLAATALTSPITLGIAAVAAVGVGLWMAWQNRLDQLKREAASAYQESTEMAKVYNIELNKTGKALQENAEYAKAYGIAAKNMGRGQVEKDYAKAIDKQYTMEMALERNVHCLVTFSSIAAVEAVSLGKPAIVLGPSAAAPVTSSQLKDIENPYIPTMDEVEAWLANLAYHQFTEVEMRDGTAWSILNQSS
jgi:hypothetical protein